MEVQKMPKWTESAQDYERVRKLILEIPGGELVSITLKNGTVIDGWVVGTTSGTDIGENLRLGRGPLVTSMYGEIRLQIQNGHVIVIDAVDAQNFRRLQN
jgi:hypothetical protein